MQNRRISTTISQKHWELLKKYAEKFETQQKAIEFALENLENGSKLNPALTPEEKLWMDVGRSRLVVMLERNAFKLLIETADTDRLIELFIRDKPVEFAIEYYFQKPLKECSLKEVMDGLVINLKITNWLDTIDYTDDGSHYTLIITHSMGLAFSKLLVVSTDNMFKNYGVKTESITSTKSIFIRVFKNQCYSGK